MLRLGLIGTGFGLEVQTEALKYNHVFKLVSVCSRDPKEAKEAKKTADFSTWYSDWKELIERDKLDIICISTPNHLHYPMAKYALEHDKHIILSAPFTLSVTEAEELTALANQKNKVCVVDHHLNFLPARKYALRLIKDGKIGPIHTVERTIRNNSAYLNSNLYNWKHSADCGGGFYLENAPHDIDYLLRALGGVHKVSLNLHTATKSVADAQGNKHPATADDQFQMILRFHKNAVAIINGSSTAAFKDSNEFLFHGENGSILLNNDNEILLFNLKGERERIAIPPNFQITSLPGHKQRSPFYMFSETIASAIYNNSPVTPTFDEALHVQRVIQAGLESSKFHQWIEVGAEDQTIVPDTSKSPSLDKIFE